MFIWILTDRTRRAWAPHGENLPFAFDLDEGGGPGGGRRAETQGNRVLSAIIREAEAAPLRYSGNLWVLPEVIALANTSFPNFTGKSVPGK